jgi:hypothetical protein
MMQGKGAVALARIFVGNSPFFLMIDSTDFYTYKK